MNRDGGRHVNFDTEFFSVSVLVPVPVLSCLVSSCVTLVACVVFFCCVVSCAWRCLSLCVCCQSVVLSVASRLLAGISSLVFPCTCVCRLSRLSVLCWFLGLCFVFAHFFGSIVGFCVLFRVLRALVLFVSVSCRLCVSLSVVVLSCLPVAPYVVDIFVCILCCEETDDDQVPSLS